MEGKKKYFALILFLFLGLMIFTFANPAEEEKEFQNGDKDQSETVTDRREETTEEDDTDEQDEQDVLNVVTDQNQGNNQQNVVTDNSLRDALAAVEKAEGTYTQEDVNAAKDLVNNVTDTTEKGKLEDRLEEVEAGIAVLALLEDLEKQVEDAEEKAHMTDATAYRDDNKISDKIDALNNETVKEALAKRLTTVSKLLDDNAAPVASVEAKAYNDHVEITAEDEAGNPFKLFLSKDSGKEEEITSGDKTTSEGVYTLRLVDDAFNEDKVTFVVDKTLPKLKDLTSGGHYKEITLNADDKTKVTIKVTNMDTSEEKEVSDGTKLTEDATYMIELTDEAGNVNYYYLAIDSAKPTIEVNGKDLTDKSYLKETTDVVIKDKFLTTVSVTYEKDGNKTTEEYLRADFEVGARNENFKFTYSLDKNGTYTITAKDKFGNTTVRTVTVDTKAPVASYVALLSNKTDDYKYIKNDETVRVLVAFDEEIKVTDKFILTINGTTRKFTRSGDKTKYEYIAQYHIPKDEKNMKEGKVTFSISGYEDFAGNTVEAPLTVANHYKYNSLTYDRTPATITLKDTRGKVLQPGYYTHDLYAYIEDANSYTATLNDKSNDKPYTSGKKISDKKNYILTVVDAAGNTSSIEFAIDKDKPIVKGVENGKYYNEPVTPTITDKHGNLDKVTLNGKDYVSGTEITEEGTYELIATDKAKNSRKVTFTIDKTLPGIKIKGKKNKWTNTQTFDVIVTEKNLDKVYYAWTGTYSNYDTPEHRLNFMKNKEAVDASKIKDNGDGTYTISITTDFEGSKILVVKVTDLAGNVVAEKSEWFRIDDTAPVVDEGEDLTLEGGIDTVPTLTATVTDNTQKPWTIEPSYINRHNADGTIDRNLPAVDINVVGKYNVVFQAKDKAGNLSEKKSKMIYVVDTTKPTVTLNGEKTVYVEAGIDSYTDAGVTVTDNIDKEVKTIKSQVKYYKYDATAPGDHWVYVKPVLSEVNTKVPGRYIVAYWAVDAAGNSTELSKTTRIVFVQDTTPATIKLPGVQGATHMEYRVESGTKVTIDDVQATVTDNVDKTTTIKPTSIRRYYRREDNKASHTYAYNEETGFETADVGYYELTYKYKDAAGNESKAIMLLVMSDTNAPTVTANVTDGRTYIDGEDVTHLIFKVYKKGETTPVHTVNSETSPGGKYFSMKTANYGEGLYTVVVTDEGGNSTQIETELRYNELTALNYRDSVTLTKDITLDELLTIAAGTTKTIDLNNHKLIVKNTNADHSRMIKNYGKLIIKNGTLVNENYDSYGLVDNYATGELVIENVKVKDNGSYDGSSIKNRGGNVTVTNSEFTIVSSKGYGLITGAAYGNDDEIKYGNTAVYNEGTLVIKNTKITSDSERAYALNLISGTATVEDVNAKGNHGGLAVTGGTAVIKNMSYESDVHYGIYVANNSTEGTNITINGGKFIGQLEGMLLYNSGDKGDIQVTINGGEFTSKTTAKALRIAKGTSTHEMNVTIKGGTFKDTDVTDYIDKTVYRQDTTDWTVKEISKIDNVSYLKEAFSKGGTYTLEKDLTLTDESLKVASGVDLTINTNGKTISGTYTEKKASNIIEVLSGASLTLTGNGTITYTAQYPDSNYGYATNTIVNRGKLIIDGPTLINTTPKPGASYVIDNYSGSDLVVKSGTISQTGGDIAIRMFSGSATPAINVTINGGTISGYRAVWIQQAGSNTSVAPQLNLTINGGTLKSTDTEYNDAIYSYSYGNSQGGTTVKFNGGTIDGWASFGGGKNKTVKENVVITGGTFTQGIGRYVDTTEDPSGWIDIVIPTQE